MKIISYVLEDGQPPVLLDDYLVSHSKIKLGKKKIAQTIRLINSLLVYHSVRLRLEKTNIKNRTALQNNSIHLLFKKTADELNGAGLDIKQAIPARVQWSLQSVKDYIWRTLQKARTGKDSTTQLNTTEIDEVYDEYNKYLSEHNIHVPFQCVENMLFEKNYGE